MRLRSTGKHGWNLWLTVDVCGDIRPQGGDEWASLRFCLMFQLVSCVLQLLIGVGHWDSQLRRRWSNTWDNRVHRRTKCTVIQKRVILPNYFHARGGVFKTPKCRKEFDQNCTRLHDKFKPKKGSENRARLENLCIERNIFRRHFLNCR